MDAWYELEGARLHALERGEGPTVLKIHGTGGSAKTWFHALRRLGDTHRSVAVDLPGYGLSELPAHLDSVDDYADLLASWIRHAGWGPVVAVGTSMGGRVALQLTLDHPELVRGLVLINSSGLRLPEVPTLSPRDLTPAEFTQALFYRPSPIVVRAGAEAADRWLGTMEKLTRRPLRTDLQERLHEIRVPSLVVWGEHDKVIPPAYAEAFQRGIPGAELAWIAQAGHVPLLERPGEVNAVLVDFLERLEGRE